MMKLDSFRFFAWRIKPRAKSQRGLQLDIIHVSWRFVADAVKFLRGLRDRDIRVGVYVEK